MMPPPLHVCNGFARRADKSMLALNMGTTGHSKYITAIVPRIACEGKKKTPFVCILFIIWHVIGLNFSRPSSYRPIWIFRVSQKMCHITYARKTIRTGTLMKVHGTQWSALNTLKQKIKGKIFSARPCALYRACDSRAKLGRKMRFGEETEYVTSVSHRTMLMLRGRRSRLPGFVHKISQNHGSHTDFIIRGNDIYYYHNRDLTEVMKYSRVFKGNVRTAQAPFPWQMVHLPSCQLHISVNRIAQIYLELHFCVELHTKKSPEV